MEEYPEVTETEVEESNNNGHRRGEIAEAIEEIVRKHQAAGGDGVPREGRTFTAVESNKQGVLNQILHAIKDVRRDYRQELKTANWADVNAAAKCVAAIHECITTGTDYTPIIDRVIAESAGVAGARLELVVRGLTHTTFNTNSIGFQKTHWWNRRSKEPVGGQELMQ